MPYLHILVNVIIETLHLLRLCHPKLLLEFIYKHPTEGIISILPGIISNKLIVLTRFLSAFILQCLYNGRLTCTPVSI